MWNWTETKEDFDGGKGVCFKKDKKQDYVWNSPEFKKELNELFDSLPPTSSMDKPAKGYRIPPEDYWGAWIYCSECGFDGNILEANYCGRCGKHLKIVGAAKLNYDTVEYELEDFEENSDAKEKEKS